MTAPRPTRSRSDQAPVVQAVTVIMGVVVGFTFLFGFGNVLNLNPPVGVPVWVARSSRLRSIYPSSACCLAPGTSRSTALPQTNFGLPPAAHLRQPRPQHRRPTRHRRLRQGRVRRRRPTPTDRLGRGRTRNPPSDRNSVRRSAIFQQRRSSWPGCPCSRAGRPRRRHQLGYVDIADVGRNRRHQHRGNRRGFRQ